MKNGVELISEERAEQIKKHKRSIQSDVKHNWNNQLSFAAALLSAPNPQQFWSPANNYGCPQGWNQKIWDKMRKKPYKERLIIAGALLAAEIDRLQGLD